MGGGEHSPPEISRWCDLGVRTKGHPDIRPPRQKAPRTKGVPDIRRPRYVVLPVRVRVWVWVWVRVKVRPRVRVRTTGRLMSGTPFDC